MPIVLEDGQYFGNLCAMDPRPTTLQPWLEVVILLGRLIAHELDQTRAGRTADEARCAAERAVLDAAEASELREQFIAILGHDLRNPLHAVLGAAEMVRRYSSDPRVTRMTAQIQNSATRMASLIDDVMDFARGRLGGGFGVDLRSVDNLGSILEEVVNEIRTAHAEIDIVARIDVDRTV